MKCTDAFVFRTDPLYRLPDSLSPVPPHNQLADEITCHGVTHQPGITQKMLQKKSRGDTEHKEDSRDSRYNTVRS